MDINTQLIKAIFTLCRLMKEGMSYDADLVHLSVLQIQALVFLKHNPNAQMSDIANNFKIELPSATSLVNKLVRTKLVERKTDEKDRRLVRIVLTPKGSELLTNAMKERNKKMSQDLTMFSAEDKKILLNILEKFIATMEKSHEK